MQKKIYSRNYSPSLTKSVFTSFLTKLGLALRRDYKWYILVLLLVIPALVIRSALKTPEASSNISKSMVFQRQLIGQDQYVGNIEGVMKTAIARDKNGGRVTVSRGDNNLEFIIPIDNPTLNGQSVGILQATDVSLSSKDKLVAARYNLVPNGIKEEIILNKIPLENKLPISMRLQNLQVKINSDDIPAFYDSSGQYQFHFERPYVKDGAGSVSYAVKYRFTDQNGTKTELFKKINNDNVKQELLASNSPLPPSSYSVFIEIDPEWLHDPERILPIVIDPTVVHDTTAEFSAGQFNRTKDTGSGSSPVLETFYRELPTDQYTVGLWHMNETVNDGCSGGQDACDSSGNGLHGVATGTTINTTTQKLGVGARTLNGSTDLITVPENDGLDPKEITIEAWIKPNVIQTGNFVNKGTNSGYRFRVNAAGTVTFFDRGATNPLASTTILTSGTWYHVAATGDASGLRIYVNGILNSSNSIAYGGPNTANDLTIGSTNVPNEYYSGDIDEVRISNIARSPEEIRLSALRRPYSVYTSDVIDLTKVHSWNSLSWTELGVATGDGENLMDSTDLVAQWKFNETSGTTANNDAEGTSCGGTPANCDGTLSGFDSTASQDADPDSSWTANNRRWGAGAVNLDATDSYVYCDDANCGGTSLLDIGTGSLSVSAWIKTAKSTRQAIVSKGNASGQYSYELETGAESNGEPDFYIFNTADGAYMRANGNVAVNDDKWHHIVGTYDGTTIKLYVDGKLNASTTTTSGTKVTDSTSPFQIGARTDSATQYFSGNIDAVSVHKRALTDAEILSNYNVANIELQTRVGSDSSPDDGSWEEWKPVTGETQIDSFDSNEDATHVYELGMNNFNINQTWTKLNNTAPANSDTISTDGTIPLGTSGKGDDERVHSHAVIKDNTDYKMWYGGFDGTNYRIYYAAGVNGLDWLKNDNTTPADSNTTNTNGRIGLGTSGTGDDAYTRYPDVIKDGSTYKMWYAGHDGTSERIYYATSPDGLVWTKYDNTAPSNSDTTGTNGRIPLGTDGTGDDANTICPSVIKDGSTYKMWYTGSDGTNYRIYYATSPDGLTWTKYDNTIPTASNTIGTNGRIPLGASGSDTVHAMCASVIKDGLYYKMWYTTNGARISYATSMDGLTWIKYDNSTPGVSDTTTTNGRIPLGSGGSGDDAGSGYSKVIKDGSSYKTWYTGIDGTNYRIYYASMVPLPYSQSTDSIIKAEGTGSEKLDFRPQADIGSLGLWHLDETGGSTNYIKDSSFNGFHGTPTGTSVINGISGKAREFNGSSDYINMGDNDTIDAATALSGCTWVYHDTAAADQEIFAKSNATADGLLLFRDDVGAGSARTDVYTIFVADSADAENARVESAQNAAIAGAWNHVCFSYQASSATGLHLYVNGVEDAFSPASTSTIAAIDAGINPFRLGSLSAGGNYLDGKMDEAMLWGRVISADEVAELYRGGRDRYFNKTISSTDLSGKNTIPFYVAADRPGTYLEATVGESAFDNFQPGSNTAGLWSMDDGKNGNNSVLKYVSTNTAAANAYSYMKSVAGQSTVVATGDTIEYDVYLATSLINTGTLDARFTDATYLRSFVACHAADLSVLAYQQWFHRVCTVPAGANGKTIDWIDLVNENDTATASTVYYDNIVVRNSSGAIKATLFTGTSTAFNVVDLESNAANTQTMTVEANQTEAVAQIDQHTDTFIKDTSNNNNNGRPYGTQPAKGKIGMARRFNQASSNQIYVEPDQSLNLSSSYTISFWINFTDASDGSYRQVFSNTITGGSDRTPAIWVHPTYTAFHWREDPGNLGFLAVGPQGESTSFNTNQWYYITGVKNGTTIDFYVNGDFVATATGNASMSSGDGNMYLGNSPSYLSAGMILDEFRIENSTHSADEIRQSYELQSKAHPITIDFGAKLSSDDLITSSSDTGFEVDGTLYGFAQQGDNLYKGDKIIVRENYNGIEFNAQGTVTAVNAASGAVTVSSWDTGSTFPTGGYTEHASVFKWQREYWNIAEPLDSQINGITNLTLRMTDGFEGRTVWVDDWKSAGNYLTTSGGSTITSTTNYRYFQYRLFEHSANEAVSPYITSVTLDYDQNTAPGTPTLDSPANATVGASLSPTLKTTATDAQSENIQYKIEICTDSDMTIGCQTYDQTDSQAGWTGQNADSDTTYTSGTQGSYTVQAPLSALTTYYWRSYAIDPSGLNSFGATQGTPYSFTTTSSTYPTNCRIDKAPDGSSLTVSWNDNSTGEANYEIQKNTDAGGFSLLQTLAANSTSYEDSSVASGHTYQYRVAAIFSGSVYSQWCTTSTINLDVGQFEFSDLNLEGVNVN